jgi:hypothetical protein
MKCLWLFNFETPLIKSFFAQLEVLKNETAKKMELLCALLE